MEKIENSKVGVAAYGGTGIKVLGKCKVRCACNNKIVLTEFLVVDVNKDYDPLLGLESCQKFDLLRRNVYDIRKFDVFAEYRNVFQGLGTIKTERCNIKLKEDAIPRVVPCRKIPFKLHKNVKAELDRMCKNNIIKKVDEPTAWVNPIVIVKKANKDIRLCLDPLYLNQSLMRQHCKLPTFEELTTEIKGAQIFSTLDANKGFYQILFTEESSKLRTFYCGYIIESKL